MILLILGFCAISYATTVYTTLNQRAFPCFKWNQTIRMSGNRKQPNQPPSEWINMTFELPPWDFSIQFTHNMDSLNDTLLGEIPYYSVNEYSTYQIFVSFATWSMAPWNLWIGIGNEFLC
jgi:hypothetical protein